MRSILFCALVLLLQASNTIGTHSTSVCLSGEERKLYELMMSYRKEKGLESIPLSAKLTEVAQVHAKDLVENYIYNEGNCNPHSWSTKGNWSACCYTSDHKQAKCMWDKPKEITGYEGAGYEIAYYNSMGVTAEQGLNGWKNSSGHNPVIVNEGIWKNVTWRAVGIGFYKSYGVVWFGETGDEISVANCTEN